MTKVAVVEDNSVLREYLVSLIASEPDHTCVCVCSSAEEAMAKIPASRADVLLMSFRLAGETGGPSLAAQLRERMPGLQIIRLTVCKDVKMVFQAVEDRKGGYPLRKAGKRGILEPSPGARKGRAPAVNKFGRRGAWSTTRPPSVPLSMARPLSARELEILALLAEGLSNKEIAARLLIAFTTVRTHLTHIYKKLNIHRRTEAIGIYFQEFSLAAR
jgi:DNA-binding NarL/FixJ family response regulator